MYSKGVSWIDDCRIPFVDENIDFTTTQKGKVYGRNSLNESITERNTTHYSTQGRFPANILVSDDMLNDGVISKQSGKIYEGKKSKTSFGQIKSSAVNTNYADKGSNSRYYNIDKWFENLIK
jgi:hypothetical protein